MLKQTPWHILKYNTTENSYYQKKPLGTGGKLDVHKPYVRSTYALCLRGNGMDCN